MGTDVGEGPGGGLSDLRAVGSPGEAGGGVTDLQDKKRPDNKRTDRRSAVTVDFIRCLALPSPRISPPLKRDEEDSTGRYPGWISVVEVYYFVVRSSTE